MVVPGGAERHTMTGADKYAGVCGGVQSCEPEDEAHPDVLIFL